SHPRYSSVIAFFFHHTPTTVIYTLSLHDALPILKPQRDDFSVVRERAFARSQAGENPLPGLHPAMARRKPKGRPASDQTPRGDRSEEHTSELQSRENLVCRLLLEKKKNRNKVEQQ